MKTKKTISFRQLWTMSVLLLCFACCTIFLFSHKRDERRFRQLTSGLFVSEMCADTLNMHYTLADPANFGILDYTPVLSGYTDSSAEDETEGLNHLLQALLDINPERLDSSDRYTYTLLVRFLENRTVLSRYPYYAEPFSPASGVQSQLPILLAEYAFREEKDVEDYLALLDQTDEYFASLLQYEISKKEAGLFMAASSADKVIAQCRNIVTEKELLQGDHFLQTTFSERVAHLVSSGRLSPAQAEKYIDRNNSLLNTVFLPAYLMLADGLSDLKDESIALGGTAAWPDGAAYYQAYMTSQTGSRRSVPQVRELLLDAFSREWNYIGELTGRYPDASLLYLKNSVSPFPLTGEDEILAELQRRMKSDFPEHNGIYVTVKDVSESLESYTAPAFYLTPPIDDYDENVIYINQSSTSVGLELFTTLAHEGYPGHLYQTTYTDAVLYGASAGSPQYHDNDVRSILWYGGYLEGWALYAEFLSFDYASAIYEEQGDRNSAIAVQLEKHNRSLQICLYSLLDIMINYENTPESEISGLLSEFGIDSASSVHAIYSYIAEEPCNYLKYYLGYLELLELKKDAERLWGDGYSDYLFHRFYLESGPSDFTSLRERLEQTDAPSLP